MVDDFAPMREIIRKVLTETGYDTFNIQEANDGATALPLLLAGSFARVRFPMTTEQAMLVPDSALLTDQQGRYAVVVNDRDEVEVRRVRVGALDGAMRVVEEGLDPDDRVIVLGVLKARPGAKVTPKVQEALAGRG